MPQQQMSVSQAASVLSVPPSASMDTIKAAWKRAATASHPDSHGGSEEAFQLVTDAYERLCQNAHEVQWGTSSSAIGAGITAPRKAITWEQK